MGNNEPKVKLRIATDGDKNKLKNLQQLYLHDLSEYTVNLDVNSNGIFENNDLDFYYSKEELIPLVVEYKAEVIGFIFLNKPPFAPMDCDYCINEFFILRKYRGQGLALEAIKELFSSYSGKYMMLELVENKTAISFWRKVLAIHGCEYEETEIMDESDKCLIQKFEV